MAYILNEHGLHRLNSKALNSVSESSVGKGGSLPLREEVESRCSELLSRLDQLYARSPLGLMLNALDEASRENTQ